MAKPRDQNSHRKWRIGAQLILCLSIIPAPNAFGQESAHPKIIEEKHGNITNYEVEGNLAATQPIACIPIGEARNNLTPADIYPGVRDCIEQDKFDEATDLFALAGIYARFDAERVSDKTAGQAGEILIMNTFSALSEEKKSRFLAVFNRIAKDRKSMGPLCAQIRKIGAPDYYPKYMILHGMKAFLGDSYEGALSGDFDQAAAWNRLQADYLHCPKSADK